MRQSTDYVSALLVIFSATFENFSLIAASRRSSSRKDKHQTPCISACHALLCAQMTKLGDDWTRVVKINSNAERTTALYRSNLSPSGVIHGTTTTRMLSIVSKTPFTLRRVLGSSRDNSISLPNSAGWIL